MLNYPIVLKFGKTSGGQMVSVQNLFYQTGNHAPRIAQRKYSYTTVLKSLTIIIYDAGLMMILPILSVFSLES